MAEEISSSDLGPRRFGKYHLQDRIGSGGMAEIWRSELEGIDGFKKVLVVKKILPRYANNRQFITMFVQEAKVCSGLHHANVVQIYELGEVEGEYYIAMEFVEGHDLLKVLTRASKAQHPVPPELCCYVVMEVAKGLGYAHAATDHDGRALDIIHLDCSPSNILISNKGEVKLTDFGVARATVEGREPTGDDRLKGKLGYMSPEQVTGKPLDYRSDIFSLGIILYELFTLKRLFLGRSDIETLSNIRDANVEPRLKRHPEIPPAVADVVRRSLRVNVETRYQSAEEIEEDLSQYLFEERVRVTAASLSEWLHQLFDMEVPDTPKPRPVSDSAPSDTAVGRAAPARVEPDLVRPEQTETGISQPGVSVEPVEVTPGLPPVAEYRFKSDTNDIWGPVTPSNLKKLLKSRSIAPDELVSVDGGDFKPAREDSKVGPFIARQEFGELDADEVGVFGPANAARLMARMAAFRRTGRFALTRKGVRKELYFKKGKPIHIATNNKKELFGSVLLESGLISQEQLDQAIEMARSSPAVPVGTALVQLGAIDQMAVFQQLEVQFKEKFMDVFSWHEGFYEYHRNREPPKDAVPHVLDPYPAITEGLRRYMKAEWLEDYFATAATKTIRLSADPAFDASKLAFVPREHRVRNYLASRPVTLPALLEALGTNPQDRQNVLFVLFVLHQAELIRMR